MGEKTKNKKADVNKTLLPESDECFEENQDNRLESSQVVYFFWFVFLAMPHGLWDLNSPTKDGTRAPALELHSLNHWIAREAPDGVYFHHL